jgi:hypothetical protein
MTFRAMAAMAGEAIVGLALLAACGGGPGPSGSVSLGRDNTGTGRDDPGAARQDPGSDRQDPGGGSGSTSKCIACDQWYKCGAGDVHLVTNDKGVCVKENATYGLAFGCDGTFTSAGQHAGTWTKNPDGGFTLITSNGQVVCTPESAPQQGGGSKDAG